MHNKGMLFDELSSEYLEKSGLKSILSGVLIPIEAGDDGEFSTLSIAFAMAKIIGSDYNFRYSKDYLAYINYIAGENASNILIKKGFDELSNEKSDNNNFEKACAYFRCALLIEPKSCDALYLYALACKKCYEAEDMTEDYVGSFKAESADSLELLTMLHPKFATGYYYLGYVYLNMGLYQKAQLTWLEYMKLTYGDNDIKGDGDRLDGYQIREIKEMRSEISERLNALEAPVIIEKACNEISRGNYKIGRDILVEYTDGRYSDWWPLWYYLGLAEFYLGDMDKAIKNYKKALSFSPSNVDIMNELAEIYENRGDVENYKKYRNKIDIVKGLSNTQKK